MSSWELMQESGIYYCSFMAVVLAVMLIARYAHRAPRPFPTLGIVLTHLGVGLAVWAAVGALWAALVPFALSLVLSLALHRTSDEYAIVRPIFLINVGLGMVLGAWWVYDVIAALPLPPVAKALVWAIGGPLVAIVSIVSALPEYFSIPNMLSQLFRVRFPRPQVAPEPRTGGACPKVSIHVPCYAEPPEVVIGTLNALARLRYSHFEVVVVDNNTKDEALWRPVERHCEWLGPRFRFFHVDPLAGAKGGALNFALDHTADDAELVAVIDADYHAVPEFLSRLVGYFDDPKIGYVQTPHDYRDFEESPYQQSCYGQYMPNYKLVLPGLSQWDASHIVGTMCVIRRKAIEEAGRWSESCLTEDSELGVRIHALGYTSHYFREAFGHGLIPETYSVYKKQRFRWTAGPIQQLRLHWRTFLPRPFGRPSGMSRIQRIVELSHSLEYTPRAVYFLLLPVLVANAFYLASQGVVIPIRPSVLLLLGTQLLFWLVMQGLEGGLIGRSAREIFLGVFAKQSLHHTHVVAVLAASLSKKPLAWVRTDKFKAVSSGWRALASTRAELTIGATYIALAVLLAPHASYRTPDVVLMSVIGLALESVKYLCAPGMAVLAELQLQRAERAAEAPAIAGGLEPAFASDRGDALEVEPLEVGAGL